MVSCRDALSAGSPKIERIEGNQPHRTEEIHRSHEPRFFSNVKADSIGFERVAVLAIGLVRKGAVDDRRLRFLESFFTFLALTVRSLPFKRTGRTHTHTHRKMNWCRILFCLAKPTVFL